MIAGRLTATLLLQCFGVLLVAMALSAAFCIRKPRIRRLYVELASKVLASFAVVFFIFSIARQIYAEQTASGNAESNFFVENSAMALVISPVVLAIAAGMSIAKTLADLRDER